MVSNMFLHILTADDVDIMCHMIENIKSIFDYSYNFSFIFATNFIELWL